jgi:tetratricopeptide (TPR) repeat protein
LLVAGAICGSVFLIKGGVGFWHQFTAPAPPSPDLTGVDDPLVVKAVTSARTAVERNMGVADAWGTYGKVLRAHEFEAESNCCFRQAERLNPKDPRWPYLLGRGLRSSDPDQAIACLERSVRCGGVVMSPRLLLGELLLDRHRIEEAELLFRAVLEKEPENPRAHLALGRLALGRNQLEQSLDHLERAAAGAPDIKATHSVLAQVYSRLGKTEQAEEQVRLMAPLAEEWYWPDPYQDEVLALWVGLKARLSIAADFWKQRRRDEAIRYLQAVVADYPESEKAQFMLGDKLNIVERYAESEAPLREAVRLDPAFARAHFELGYCLHQKGRSDQAAACYRKAIELQPDYALAHYNLSFCLAEQGDRPAAIASLRIAVRYKPEVAKAHRNLGKLLAQQGEYVEAREALQRAVQLAPSDQESKELLERTSSRSSAPSDP